MKTDGSLISTKTTLTDRVSQNSKINSKDFPLSTINGFHIFFHKTTIQKDVLFKHVNCQRKHTESWIHFSKLRLGRQL